MNTTLVNKKKKRGTFYIGRGSVWGNPFSHLEVSQAKWEVKDREEAITTYENWVRNSEDKDAVYVRNNLYLLRGEVLECFCVPLACHGEVLIKMIEEIYGD